MIPATIIFKLLLSFDNSTSINVKEYFSIQSPEEENYVMVQVIFNAGLDLPSRLTMRCWLKEAALLHRQWMAGWGGAVGSRKLPTRHDFVHPVYQIGL